MISASSKESSGILCSSFLKADFDCYLATMYFYNQTLLLMNFDLYFLFSRLGNIPYVAK